MDADTHRAKVQSHLQEAERQGVAQTPTFVIGGTKTPGAIPYDTFKKLVDDELAKAPGAKAPGAAPDSAAKPKAGAK
jgi:predicted DsbA family dithiol-disulfide isomerase